MLIKESVHHAARPKEHFADPSRAEAAVLGALLLDNKTWRQVAQLDKNDFSLQAHQNIFERMKYLFDSGSPVDMITLVEEIDRHGEIARVGGVAYLSSLIDGVVEQSIERYVRMVRDAAGARHIAHGTEAICELARKGANPSELRAHLIELSDLAGQYESTGSGTIQNLEDVPDTYSLKQVPTTFIVSEFIPQGTIVLLTGSPGVGKSSLAWRLVTSCALGTKFLSHSCERVKCLYLDRENPLTLVQRRMELIAGAPIPELHIWGGWLKEEPPWLGDPRLLRWAAEHKPLIVFDSLVRFHTADENSASEMSKVMAHTRQLADAGATVLLLHHRAKTEANKYRGSSDILAAIDVAYSLEQVDGGLRLDLFKSRFSALKTFPIRADFAAGTFELLEGRSGADERADDVEAILHIITEKPGAIARVICDETQKLGVSRCRTLAALERETGKLWEWKPGPNRSHCYFRRSGVPGVPPYRVVEHRNNTRSRCSEVLGTPEHVDIKADNELNTLARSAFQGRQVPEQLPERQTEQEKSPTRLVCPVHNMATIWWRRGQDLLCSRCHPNPALLQVKREKQEGIGHLSDTHGLGTTRLTS